MVTLMTPDERIAYIVEQARGGRSFADIGRDLHLSLSRARVQQLAKQGGVTSRDLAGTCDFCGVPLARRMASRYDIHACTACQTKRAALHVRAKRARGRPVSPRAVCAQCGATLKRPAKDSLSFCTASKACFAARMRHRYKTNADHRAYMLAMGQKARDRGYYRDYWRRRMEALPITRCIVCDEETGGKRARFCATHRHRGKPITAPRAPRPPKVLPQPHASISLLKELVRAWPTARAAYALTLLNEDGLSERAVAALLNVARSTVNSWRSGARRPTVTKRALP